MLVGMFCFQVETSLLGTFASFANFSPQIA